MPPVLLATCAAFPDGDEDAAVLHAALRKRDVDARWAVWDDPSVDWSAGPVVLRATWDYPIYQDEFLEWAHRVPVLHNPVELVRWNCDKVYLRELADAGVPVTPSVVAPPGVVPDLPTDIEFVVKPSVGAGSRGAGRFAPAAVEQAVVHLGALHAAGLTALVQPYLAEVDEAGETALMYVGGTFSHAIRKGPMLQDGAVYEIGSTAALFVPEHITAREPSPAELEVGDQALAFVRARFGIVPLYVRIDVLPGPSGPVLVELELIEPSLFLSYAEGAADRFAAAIASLT